MRLRAKKLADRFDGPVTPGRRGSRTGRFPLSGSATCMVSISTPFVRRCGFTDSPNQTRRTGCARPPAKAAGARRRPAPDLVRRGRA